MARRIVFRLDDICPQMNHERFFRMRQIFDKYDVKPVIGVVPDCRDPELNCDTEDPNFWNMVRKLQEEGWTVAMHGCFHQYVTKEKGLISHGFQSEFAGLSYDEQYKKLDYGRTKLQQYGIETDVFMAPSHSYDKDTLRALRDLGFRYVTDGLTARPYTYMGLVFIPCIEPKIANVNRLSTVCYHTNVAQEQRFVETQELLSQNREQVISFEQAKSIPQIPYWAARIEERVRFFYKYYFTEGVRALLRKLKIR